MLLNTFPSPAAVVRVLLIAFALHTIRPACGVAWSPPALKHGPQTLASASQGRLLLEGRSLAPPRAALRPTADVDTDAVRPWPDANVTLSTWFEFKHGQCGLHNQNMKLLVLLTLAISLRVDNVFLPPAMSRDTFESEQPRWRKQPSSSLWDIPSITALLASYGIRTLVASTHATVPHHAVHLPQQRPLEMHELLSKARGLVDGRLAVLRRREGGGGGAGTMAAAARRTRKASKRHHSSERDNRRRDLRGSTQKNSGAAKENEENEEETEGAMDGGQDGGRDSWRDRYKVWLHVDTLFWIVRTNNLSLYTEVARAVGFNRHLVAAADAVAAKLRAASPSGSYNGLHLRVEKDWAITKGVSSDREASELATAAHLMRDLSFSPSDPLYVASAIFDNTTGRVDPRRCAACQAWFDRDVRARPIVNRHLLLWGLQPLPGLGGAVLRSEQEALVDFLVLQRAKGVVGFGESSFSFNLREYRALVGRPRGTMGMVNASQNQMERIFEPTASFLIPEAA